MKKLKVALECVVGACRVCGVYPDLGGFGEPCKRTEGLLLGEVLLKSPEVVWRSPTSVADPTRTLGECMQALLFGFNGGRGWALKLCYVSKCRNGQCVVYPGVKVQAKWAVLPKISCQLLVPLPGPM